MLSNHIYWNLGAFTTPNVLHDTLHMPLSERFIEIDGIQVPTGEITSLVHPWQSPPSPLNFTSPKPISDGALHARSCGDDCVGIDNAFIIDRPSWEAQDSMASPHVIWHSPDTGIQMTMSTNMPAVQLFSCITYDGSIAVKKSQMTHGVKAIEKYGCLVIEPEGWIDGISQPQWGQMDKQVFTPTGMPAVNAAVYEFSVKSS
jgi:aldose 1-epimerase